ncbi:MAG TPA: glycosyltransferase family 4 protein [Terriglobales bacterium]|jgi:glycosyltransferase involved in cell wall biosynthesis
MRLLIATQARGPIGGVESYLRGMAAQLRAAGCELGILYEQRAEGASAIDWRGAPLGYAERPAYAQPAGDPREPRPAGAAPLRLPGAGRRSEFRDLLASTLPTVQTARPPRDDPYAGCTEFDVAELGREAALAAARRWRPERIWAHGLADGEMEARLLELAPAVLYAHNYDGACATGSKMHRWPRPVPCSRPLGAGCVAVNFTRHCGMLNPSGFVRSYRRQRERARGLRGYSAIMVASLHMAGEFRRAAGASGPAVTVVGYPLLAPRAEVLASPSGRPHHVVMLARLTAPKGGEVLLRACAAVQGQLRRRLRVTIAGDGPERRRWQDLALRLDLDARFPGWLSAQERSQLLADADLLAVPSLWPEPYGLVGMEAAAQGVPAVAFAHGGILDWLEPGLTGESAGVTPPSAQGLAAALVRALEDPEHWRQMREQAWRHSAGFTPAAHLKRLAPLLGLPGVAAAEAGADA